MLTLTSTVPQTITLEAHAELTSSTPASFEDIPPVLRFVDHEVEIEFDPTWVEVSGKEGGRVKGTLWVTERSITFLPSSLINPPTSASPASHTQQGFTLPYPTLTLHAISPGSGPDPAFLYCQLDDPTAGVDQAGTSAAINGNGTNGHAGGEESGEEEEEQEEDEDDGEDEDTPMREMRIYLTNSEQLNSLFSSLSYCSSLYPSLDPSSSTYGAFGQDGDAQEQALNFGTFDPERLLAGISIPGLEGEFEDADAEGEGEQGVEGASGADEEAGSGGRERVEGEAGRTRSDFQGADTRFKPY